MIIFTFEGPLQMCEKLLTLPDLGDDWEAEDVERVYGDMSLEDALADRRNDIGWLGGIIGMILNRGED